MRGTISDHLFPGSERERGVVDDVIVWKLRETADCADESVLQIENIFGGLQTLNEQKIFPDESRATSGKTEYAFMSLLFLCFLWQSSVAQFDIDWRKVCKTFWQN